MKKLLIIIFVLSSLLVNANDLFTAKEKAMGNILFENNAYEFFSFDVMTSVDENLQFNGLSYGYGINLGDPQGLSFGYFKRESSSSTETLKLEYFNYSNESMGIGLIFDEWKKVYAVGASVKMKFGDDYYLKVVSQGNIEDKKISTLNVGTVLKINRIELMAGQSDISMTGNSSSLPFGLNPNINFGASLDLGQIIISGSSKYDFQSSTFEDIGVSLKVSPFRKTESSFSDYYYTFEKERLALEKQKEVTKTVISIAGLIALVSVVAIVVAVD